MASEASFGRFTEGTLSSHDQVARTLGVEILGGLYKPGEKLPVEADMLARFGVSRTVLREAFKTLTAKGLIVSKTRVGTVVLDSAHWNFFDAAVLGWKVSQGFDIAFVRDLADVRRAIEAAAAAAAAKRCSPEDIAELRRCLARMDAATASASDFALADLDFHKTVGRASGNVLMRSLAAVVETALLASFRMSSPVREAEEHAASVAGHRRIIDAIEAGDADEAATAMRDIIGHGLSRIERGATSS
ncbi:FadR family transcriptional regulator [Sphingomonas aliaeris]|uniref:FadR family transcriptional regulator n=1 Tax=Sphingomonas aliaeris TaxID=2759526 RepID=A0A974NUR1_9SPHN|nr:FadR/GntR family transcriptional regulator [Sphingomonas aliaeris]QQV77343.1 FadR family transcriptional regulator [Sphingomonas aliaeris]